MKVGLILDNNNGFLETSKQREILENKNLDKIYVDSFKLIESINDVKEVYVAGLKKNVNPDFNYFISLLRINGLFLKDTVEKK